MPIYEYRCQECGTTTEFLVGVSADLADQSMECASCHSRKLKRLMSAINIGKGSAAPACGPQGDCGRPGSGMGSCCGGSCGGH